MPRLVEKYEGRRFFSVREAAEYTGTPFGTFKHHAYVAGRIQGTVIGRTKIFTREQLDDYEANGQTTDIGPGRFTISDAAQYLGIEMEEVEAAVTDGRLPYVEYAGVKLFTQDQLDDFHEKGRTDLQPGPIPFFSTEEAADYAGMDVSAIKQHLYGRYHLESELVGAARVIDREDLDRFVEEKRDRGRPPGSD